MYQTSNGTNGARAAAIAAGTQAMASPKLLNTHSSLTRESSPKFLQRRNERQKIGNESGPGTLRLPEDSEMNRSRSPSDIAAKLAAARYAPQKQQDLAVRTGQTGRQQSRDQDLRKDSEAPTDITSIAPTDVLVSIFERKSAASPNEASTSSVMRTSNQGILSPKPLRPSMGGNFRPDRDNGPGKEQRTTQTNGGMNVQPAINTSSAHQASAQAVMLPKALDLPRAVLRAPKPDALAVYGEPQSRQNSQNSPPSSARARKSHLDLGRNLDDSFSFGSSTSAPRVAKRPPPPPPRRSSHLSRNSLREAPDNVLDPSTSRSSNNTGSTGTKVFCESNCLTTRESSLDNGTTIGVQQAQVNGEKWRRTPLKTVSPHLTEDSLANAIVASSLASSRAPSPTKLTGPPLPARHVKAQKVLYHQQHHDNSLYSRTPSPAKGMRHTMRGPSSLDDEASNTPNVHRPGRRNLLKKHPNKHHEGDRKRWRDEVTERERKRYEGVWAANRGIHMANLGKHGAFDESPSVTAGNAMVLNVVAREIWLRSRLPDSVLAEIWDLVDDQSTGTLSREEFVVGMWLIDQRLKGRKLPARVSDSIWASVRHLSGVKLQTI